MWLYKQQKTLICR